MSHELHRRTPLVSAWDARRLPIRTVAYHRAGIAVEGEARIERQTFDVAGRLTGRWDARLWADGGAAGTPNVRAMHDLSSRVLREESVDAGWHIALPGDAGEAREGWDGRGTHRRTAYDAQLRPISAVEQVSGDSIRCVECFTYGDATETATNRCGRMVRQDDPAGSRTLAGSSLLGEDLAQTQRFLAALDMPDWPESVPQRDALLETDGLGVAVAHTTRWGYDAMAASLSQIDAVGHTRRTYYDVAGQVVRMSLQAADKVEPTVVLHSADYDAFGQSITQTTGNGVSITATYGAADGRLQRLQAARPGKSLQDLHYDHDPVGNVLRIADDAQPTDWFNGEQVDPVNAYRYDTLYQLVEARGRESVSAGVRPGLPAPVLPGGGDASRRRNYTQTYTYDAAGNLHTLSHAQAATRTMHVDARSNRCLYMADPAHPPDIASAFDANGNLLRLEGTQAMTWDARNQLRRVTQVAREDGADDDEVYVYGGGGWRLRKLRVRQTRAVQHVAQVKYLPGLEIRTDTATGEVLHVSTVQAGRSELRHLHWRESRTAVTPSQWRYSVADHLGSGTLELDHAGDVISHEGYYPYGGTAWWAASSDIEASRKVIRYSGKERDATGLYYYGYRYYAPWLQRWINPDPAGDADGPNRFGFVRNNPMSSSDADGRWRSPGGTEHQQDDPFFAMEEAARGAEWLAPHAQPVELVNMGYDGPPSVAPVELVNMGYSPGSSAAPTVHSLTSFIDRLGASRAGASPTLSTASISTTAVLDDALDLASEHDIPLVRAPTGDPLLDLRVGEVGASVSALASMGPPAAPQRQRRRTYPHACPVAGCAYIVNNLRGGYSHHQNVHGPKTHVCSACGKAFAVAKDLASHQVTHTSDRPFACTTCNKSFALKKILDAHMNTHRPRQFVCNHEGCGKAFASVSGLSKHIGGFHMGVRHSCPGCSFQAMHKGSLVKHRKRAGH